MDKPINDVNSNIIQLRLRSNLWKKQARVSTDSRRFNNIMASGALASILFFATVINLAMSQSETESSGRGIASVMPDDNSSIANWDKGFLKRLSNKATRTMASIANRPSDLDQLRFGLLEGKYALKLQNGKIKEIVYQETVGSGDRPKYIENKDEFLMQHKGLMSVDFEAATRTQQYVENDQIIEQYELVGHGTGTKGQVRFTSDHYGRLLSVSVQ